MALFAISPMFARIARTANRGRFVPELAGTATTSRKKAAPSALPCVHDFESKNQNSNSADFRKAPIKTNREGQWKLGEEVK
jgi:hypothetical protein